MLALDMVVDGAFASACATLISNPFDVLRTRMQLQGQMKRAGEYEVLYRNLFQGMAEIVKSEGIVSLYKGLVPAVLWQVTQNGIRIGFYPLVKAELGNAMDTAQQQYVAYKYDGHKLEPGHPISESFSFFVCVAAGAFAGGLGSIVASPFTMIKTRLQSQHGALLQAQAARRAVEAAGAASGRKVLSESSTGTQFNYNGVFDALRKIYNKGGVCGLWHGAGVAAQRTMIGSAVQLTAYDFSRAKTAAIVGIPVSDIRTHLLAAICSAMAIVVFMNPFDVVMTRSYNTHIADKAQRAAGVSTVSNNIFRQAFRIYRVEGVTGLYKGSVALFSRSAPHNIATFVVLEWVRKMREKHIPERAYTQGSRMKKESFSISGSERAREKEDAATTAAVVTE